jgi:hypothetical protein
MVSPFFVRVPARLPRLLIVVALVGAAWAAPAPANAATWCGTPAPDNRTPELAGGANVHVVYAIPSDGTDRFAQLANSIETDAENIDSWWRGQDQTRTPRFDLFSFSCGAQLDLSTVRLSDAGSQLTSPMEDFIRISTQFGLNRLLTKDVADLVYFDGPITDPQVCGIGGQGALGGIAIVFLGACSRDPTDWTAAHELTHAFGAVPAAAPHSCPEPGHTCDNPADLMYPFTSGNPLSSAILDPGRDDYYGHSGSWPDVQDSPFLKHLDSQVRLSVTVTGAGRVESDLPGMDCQTTCASDWDGGTRVALRATASSGMRFVRWGGACKGVDFCGLRLDSAAAVTALFAPKRFRLAVSLSGRGNVSSRPHGISCGRRCSGAFTSYEPVRLAAKAATGWRLKAWTGACRGKHGVCSAPMTANESAHAIFVRGG